MTRTTVLWSRTVPEFLKVVGMSPVAKDDRAKRASHSRVTLKYFEMVGEGMKEASSARSHRHNFKSKGTKHLRPLVDRGLRLRFRTRFRCVGGRLSLRGLRISSRDFGGRAREMSAGAVELDL